MKLNYILPALIALLFIIVYISSGNKKEIDDLQKEIAKERVELEKIATLKKKWQSGKNEKRRVESLFNSGTLKEKTTSKKSTATSFKAKAEGIDKTQLKSITSRVLENSYRVTSLKVKKTDEFTSDIEIGVEY